MVHYRFGEFELDARSGDLHRRGRRVRLRPQPCAALLYLVERGPDLVTREELRGVIWQAGTFVHFDAGLNSCIKQVRAALGDSRVRPRFVETLTRRGYRFISAVTRRQDEPSRAPRAARIAVAPVGIPDPTSTVLRRVAAELHEELVVHLRALDSGVMCIVRPGAYDENGDRHAAVVATAPAADIVLTTRLRSDSTRFRLVCQLVKMDSGTVIWTGTYEGLLETLLGVETNLAAAVARAVHEAFRSRCGESPPFATTVEPQNAIARRVDGDPRSRPALR